MAAFLRADAEVIDNPHHFGEVTDNPHEFAEQR
jgi:hypothetical protein